MVNHRHETIATRSKNRPQDHRAGKPETDAQLRAAVARFRFPSQPRAIWQVVSTFAGFLGVCAMMYASFGLSYWLTLGLAVPGAGFTVRLFIIQHDCGHGSFFASRRANAVLGRLCSLVTFTPFANWRRQHAGHHAVWNNLDRRDSGADIYSTCLTVSEYRALSPRRRFLYRLSRHPVLTGLLLPPLVFLLLYRIPFDTPKGWRRERLSVYTTNMGIALLLLALGMTLGFERVLLVQLPIMVTASIVGVWLFSVQHRFEETLWQRESEWNFAAASLRGSSFLKLPPILQWFTGNIGFHHIHHLNPRIPNYRLQNCHQAISEFQAVPSLGLWDALRAPFCALWDEERQRMVAFDAAC
jgi:omega-6 fatty acid desaturase (delta-12 desaturase)